MFVMRIANYMYFYPEHFPQLYHNSPLAQLFSNSAIYSSLLPLRHLQPISFTSYIFDRTVNHFTGQCK